MTQDSKREVIQLRSENDAIRSDLAAKAARIAYLEERLEITHVYRIVDGTKVREKLDEPLPEHLDGIACRDETIKLLEEGTDKHRGRIAAFESAAKLAVANGSEEVARAVHDIARSMGYRLSATLEPLDAALQPRTEKEGT